MAGFKLKVTPEMESLTQVCVENSKMDPSLYGKYDVKRGLRDVNGKGVLAGLTQISSICSTDVVDGKTVPCEGRLYYRGYDIHELTQGFLREQRFGLKKLRICCYSENYQMKKNWQTLRFCWRASDLCLRTLSAMLS